MRLAEHHSAPRAFCKQAMSAWSLEARRAPPRHCRCARVYGHTTTAMHDNEYTTPTTTPTLTTPPTSRPPDSHLYRHHPDPHSCTPNSTPPNFCATPQVDEVTPPVIHSPVGGLPVEHRTDAGYYNEVDCDAAGGAGEAFGRNCPAYPVQKRREMTPDPFLVAQTLLARRPSGPNNVYFKPAGAQLNILAAAWIQAMTVRVGRVGGKRGNGRRVCACVCVLIVMHGCSRMTIDPRIPTMPGRVFFWGCPVIVFQGWYALLALVSYLPWFGFWGGWVSCGRYSSTSTCLYLLSARCEGDAHQSNTYIHTYIHTHIHRTTYLGHNP